MYGLKELDRNENNEDEFSNWSSKSSLKCCDPNKTCRHNLKNLLHSYRFHVSYSTFDSCLMINVVIAQKLVNNCWFSNSRLFDCHN
jgi:hypothetical protein